MPRATSFIAARATRGFTASYPGPPCLRRHLMRCSPHRHGLEHSLSFGPSPPAASSQPSHRLLDLWLLPRSGSRCPFRHKARSPQVRTHSFTARPPDLRRFPLITKLASGPLALVSRLYPVLVHQPAASLHASSPHSVALMQCASLRRCDQLTMGLAPTRVRPCWAKTKRAASRPPFCIFKRCEITPPRASRPVRPRAPRRRPGLRTWQSSSGTCRPARGRSCRTRPCPSRC